MSEQKKVNFRMDNDSPVLLTADQIPTLVPDNKLKEWMDGDDNPYYKIQEIKVPQKANGYYFGVDFWKSYLKKLETNLIPGSKNGHETSWGKRPPTDLLLVGGLLEMDSETEGRVYLKNYIPLTGDSGDNSIFIKENKTNLVDYSIVSYTKDEYREDEDEWWAMESLYGERNDAVDYGLGAMTQKTNSREAEKGDKAVNVEETVKALSTHMDNGNISVKDLLAKLNKSDLMVSEEQRKDLSAFGKVKSLCGDTDPVECINGLLTEKKANAKAVRDAKMDSLFGHAVHPVTKKENRARKAAELILGDQELTEELIAKVNEDSLYKSMLADQASNDSEFNRIEETDTKDNGVKVRKV
jgi:hypothetical protein